MSVVPGDTLSCDPSSYPGGMVCAEGTALVMSVSVLIVTLECELGVVVVVADVLSAVSSVVGEAVGVRLNVALV